MPDGFISPDEKRKDTGCLAVGLALLIYGIGYGPLTAVYYASSSDAYDVFYDLFYLPVWLLWEHTPMDVLIDAYENLWM